MLIKEITFNRTIEELKYRAKDFSGVHRRAFNRTIEELK